MVAEGGRGVAIVGVELFRGRAVGLGESINRIPIQGEGDRQVGAEHRLQVERGRVVVVVVGAAAVAAPLVEFADLLRDFPAVVLRIKDRNAVGGEGDGAAEKVIADRLGSRRDHRLQRDAPGVGAGVRLRQRHLLLPRGDADHHRVGGQPLAFDVEEGVVPTQAYARCKRGERGGLGRLRRGRRGGGRPGGGLILRDAPRDHDFLGRAHRPIVSRMIRRVAGEMRADRAGECEGGEGGDGERGGGTTRAERAGGRGFHAARV